MKKSYIIPIAEITVLRPEGLMIPQLEVVSGQETGGPANPTSTTNQAPKRKVF